MRMDDSVGKAEDSITACETLRGRQRAPLYSLQCLRGRTISDMTSVSKEDDKRQRALSNTRSTR